MTKTRRTQQYVVLALMLSLMALAPVRAFAYGEQIAQAGVALYTWMRGLGAVIMGLGLGGVGLKLMFQHDREGLKPLYYVIGGGLILMLAPSFVQLIQGISGGAAAFNTSGV